jgi:hypothetical protein
MRWWVATMILVIACSRIWKTKREQPPDLWALKAAVLHSMMTPPPAFLADKPDCSAAPMPDLELFCKKDCDKIGELTLKAYCAWDCGEVKNPDIGVICKLEVKVKESLAVSATECEPIHASNLEEHCRQYIADVAKQREKAKQAKEKKEK